MPREIDVTYLPQPKGGLTVDKIKTLEFYLTIGGLAVAFMSLGFALGIAFSLVCK